MDGVSLSHLTPGITYDLPAELGYWLMSRGVAEQVSDTANGLVVPLDNQLTQGVSIIPPIADAADTAAPRRRKKRQSL